MDIRRTKRRPRTAAGKPAPGPLAGRLPAPAKTRSKARPRSYRKRERFKKAVIRHAIVAVNLLIVSVAIFMVVKHTGGNAANIGVATRNDDLASNPLDRVSAADIAVNVARMADLSESVAVTMYADTVNAEMEDFSVGRSVAYAPQIMSANIKTLADIEEYITEEGDTISSLAERAGVTSDSIRWSNDLLGENLEPGIKLLIPPMNGIIYNVRNGDTPEKIASLYKVPVSQIIAFNDAEVTGLVPGKRIFIPNGQKPAPVFSFYARYGNNGYEFGNCTYYAAAKVGAPSGWGHARSWADGALRTPGWVVDKVPVPGAIAQTTQMSYFGHVAIVEDVKEEGGRIYIKYSDMNNLAGYNRVGYSDWEPADTYQTYIYRVQ